MRTRAGIVLIEDGKIALIERHRAAHDHHFVGSIPAATAPGLTL